MRPEQTLFILLVFSLLLGCRDSQRDISKSLATKVYFETPAQPTKAIRVRHMERDTSTRDFFPSIPLSKYDSIFFFNQDFQADGFDYPVGVPNGKRYFKAQEFGQDSHLGEDWNRVTGGNSDLGDPVYSIGNGLVTFSKDVCCGWGNVIRIVHKLPKGNDYEYVESIYAHLHSRYVKPGQLVRRGEKLGSIGTANGRYSAHLHLEVRDFINMSLGPGYSEDHFGFLIPSDFIDQNRPAGR
ncbi:MAG: M23 family metallopeptidase [Saprospiraceae bacterium]|nr:M23 family metallopeptidase [Saprospiraceae bacterium]